MVTFGRSTQLTLALTTAFLLLSGAFVHVSAQMSGSSAATVSVNVIPALTLSKTQDLSFGDVASGAGPVAVDARTSSRAAKFPAAGAPNTPVTVTWSAPVVLASGGGQTIPFSVAAVYGNQTDAQGASAPVGNGDTVMLSPSGEFVFWVGGSIDVGTVPQGAYAGTFSLTVAY